MIVRIATVGQYRLDDAIITDLQRFDDEIEEATFQGPITGLSWTCFSKCTTW